jgi:hypothetical protein
MRIVKKFNHFLNRRINEDLEETEMMPGQNRPEDIYRSQQDAQREFDDMEEEDVYADYGQEEEEEEEMVAPAAQIRRNKDISGNEIERMLNELTELLGAEKKGNIINFEGKRIEYYPEPDSFAIDGSINFIIGGKKTKLETPQQVFDYLKGEKMRSSRPLPEMEPALESRRFRRDRNTRRY